ncbi:MAG: hypothetical protein V1706_13715 [Pseudomonadota bacterium]
MVKNKIFITFTLIELLILSTLYGYSLYATHIDSLRLLPAKRQMVSLLGLTDFAIWTEARYTRHPSQADFFSPFQDFPSSLEHFPAGSVIAPTIRSNGENP